MSITLSVENQTRQGETIIKGITGCKFVVNLPWFFILDGCSFLRCARMMKTRSFFEKNGLDDSFDVTKCLQQIEMSDLLHVCA